MKKSLFLITLGLLLLAACGGGKRYHALMHEADSLLTAGDAVTAYRLLAEADSQKTAWSRREEMDYELLKAQAQNRAYVDFQTDSVLRVVARYYDRHGTPNQRLKAHYLLGCAYRDLHEAPLALLSWEDAVACADTLSPACDFATLFRVYGQMADIYFRQYMPEKQLDAQMKSSTFALQAGDTLYYIRGLLKRNDAYLALGDTEAIFRNVDYVRELYLQKGLTDNAAQVYQTAIRIAIEKGLYQRADSLMQVFENQSGFFDREGNISPTREIYYYNKGMYYLGINQLDSSEHWFRKALKVKELELNAYHGLMSLYKIKGNIDSTFKYSKLYDKALVEHMSQTKATAIVQAEGLYNYSHQQQIAQEQQERAHEFELALISVVASGIIVCMLAMWIFHKKKEEKLKLMEIYSKALDDLSRVRRESELLKQSLSKKEITQELLREKEEQIKKLHAVVRKLKKQIGKSANLVFQQKLEESEIVKTFQSISHDSYDSSSDLRIRIRARAATKKEWKMMMNAIQTSHPSFYLLIHQHNLSELKQKVCILSFLGFDTPTMATLINANPGSISNARTALAKELFNLSSAHDLNAYLHEL